MKHLSNNHEDCPNQNSHKLCDETGHFLLSFTKSQSTLREQQGYNKDKELMLQIQRFSAFVSQ